MGLESLHDLYVDELKDIYSAESQIIKALPKMAKAASTPELRDAFDHHLQQTHRQVERLDKIFGELGASPRGKKCVGMEGLLEEGSELLKEKAEPAVKDAGLIAAAQHVEHYEMAGYGAARTHAQMLGYAEAARALQETLDEEGDTDHKLTDIAMRTVNPQAQNASDNSGNGNAAEYARG